jgi:hypothetical protein
MQGHRHVEGPADTTALGRLAKSSQLGVVERALQEEFRLNGDNAALSLGGNQSGAETMNAP